MFRKPRLEIDLPDKPDGYGAAVVFRSGILCVSTGKGDGKRMAIFDDTDLGVRIIGGPELYDQILSCQDPETKKWDHGELVRLAYKITMEQLRHHREVWDAWMGSVKEYWITHGEEDARLEVRKSLGIED